MLPEQSTHYQNFPMAIIEMCVYPSSLLYFSFPKNLEKHTSCNVGVLKILATAETLDAKRLTCGAKIPLNLSALTSKIYAKLKTILVEIFKCLITILWL